MGIQKFRPQGTATQGFSKFLAQSALDTILYTILQKIVICHQSHMGFDLLHIKVKDPRDFFCQNVHTHLLISCKYLPSLVCIVPRLFLYPAYEVHIYLLCMYFDVEVKSRNFLVCIFMEINRQYVFIYLVEDLV